MPRKSWPVVVLVLLAWGGGRPGRAAPAPAPAEVPKELLRARLEAAPDATVLEHCAWWAEHQGQQVSEVTMWRALHRLGWTHKKSHWRPASGTSRRGWTPG